MRPKKKKQKCLRTRKKEYYLSMASLLGCLVRPNTGATSGVKENCSGCRRLTGIVCVCVCVYVSVCVCVQAHTYTYPHARTYRQTGELCSTLYDLERASDPALRRTEAGLSKSLLARRLVEDLLAADWSVMRCCVCVCVCVCV